MVSGRWQDASRILCVRLDNLGDVLMTTPAIRALKEATATRPRHVTLLGSTAGCEIARHVPAIDATLAYDAPWAAVGREQPVRTDIVSRLAAHRFDAAVIFTCYSQSALPAALVCGQAGIPLRLAHCRENPYALLTDWVRDSEPEQGIRHEVDRQLDLVGNVGAIAHDDRLALQVPAGAPERLAAVLAARGIAPERRWIVAHPGATAASRRWPPERFGEVSAQLAARTGSTVLVTGSGGEVDLGRSVLAAAGDDGSVHDLTGALTLDLMIAALAGAALLVSNNSGPVHMAAALGTPVVDLYALTNPQHTPWRVAHRLLSKPVPCANCQRSVCPERHHACLLGVSVDETVDAALDLLAETGTVERPVACAC